MNVRYGLQAHSKKKVTKMSESVAVDWADLATLDLSTFDQPGGKDKLARELANAVEKIGQVPRWALWFESHHNV